MSEECGDSQKYIYGYPYKSQPYRPCSGDGNIWNMANKAMLHPSQGVRHRAKDCVATGWNLTGVTNDPLEALGSTP
jgi:hypothetical protein